MDTRTLLDWLQEDGVRLDAYTPEDAAQVWIERIIEDPEYLQDFWLDALEEDRAQDGDLTRGILRGLNNAHKGIKNLKYGGVDYTSVLANSFAFTSQNIGRDVYVCIHRHLEDHMDKYCEELYNDCLALEYDDTEAQREDYYQER